MENNDSSSGIRLSSKNVDLYKGWLESQENNGTIFFTIAIMEQPNLNYINELSGDNLEFKNKIIGILKKNSQMKSQYMKKDLKMELFIGQSVHKLKHKISILGLEKVIILQKNTKII
jgi:hypothetical protein